MTPLPTLIAELEEAQTLAQNIIKSAACHYTYDDDARTECGEYAERLAQVLTHLPTLIEALKRQGEALELVQQNVEASASSYQERVETIGRVVRAALKKATDV